MGKAEYGLAASKAVGMPHRDALPEGVTVADFLPVGEWEPADQAAAIEAMSTRRIERIRRMVADLSAQGLARQAAEAAAHDFLTFAEYRRTVPRVDAIREQLTQIDDAKRRQAFDRETKPGKPIFYSTNEPPNQNEITFAGLFNPRTHTPDCVGYMAYIKTVSTALFDLFFWKLPALIPESDRKGHTYLTGSSGAGKSELLKTLIHADVMKDKPPCIIVIDPHGKFADEVAQQEEVVASGRLIYLNPTQSKHRTPTLNPFQCDTPEEAERIGKNLVGLFELLFTQEHSADLTANMRVIFNAFLPAMLRMPGSDILTLQKLLEADEDNQFFRQALGYMEPQQREYIRRNWSLKSFDSTKESLGKRLQVIASTPFLNFVCGQSTIDLDAAVKGRKIICLSLQPSGLDEGTTKAIGAFFLASVHAYVVAKSGERDSDKHKGVVPIHAYIDECHNFVSPTMGKILTEMRKFGLHLTLAQQFAAQGMADPDLKKAVLGNTMVKIAGFNSERATHREMARVMQLEESDLISLEKHRFYAKAGDKKAFKLYPPQNLIGERNCVGPKVWHEVIGDQLGRYYRPLEPSKGAGRGNVPPEATDAPEAPAAGMPSDFLAPPATDFR